MFYVCIVELHITVKNIIIMSAVKNYGQFTSSNNITYVGIHVKFQINLSDFNQTRTFLTDFLEIFQHQAL
jgi:hypothetical protein